MSAICISPITASASNFSQSRKIPRKPIKFFPQILYSCRGSIRNRKSQIFMKGFTEVPSDDGVEVFEQEAFEDGSSKFGAAGLEATLNTMSKWLVSSLFAAVVAWRHDAKVLWAAMGAVLNALLSTELKKIVNQERPNSTLRSDPGMPSSHAQSIFFIITFVNISMVEWYGMNALTTILSGVFIILGSYLSWLRVSQQLHTAIQVVVGAVIGSIFSVFWFWAWNAFMLNFFVSSLWVRSVVIVSAVGFCVGFVLHVIRTWIGDER